METSESSFKPSTVFFIEKLNLADHFNSFFNNKIRLIQKGLTQPITDAAYSSIPSISCQCELTSFERVTTAYMATVLKSCKVKSYVLDPVPASRFFSLSSLIW